jgi:transposase
MRNVEMSMGTNEYNLAWETYAELKNENDSLKIEIEELNAKVAWYEEQFRLSAAQKYGASSEKTPDADQLSIFNEAEKEQRPLLAEPDLEEITYKRKRSRKPTGERFADLPVEVIEYELEGEDLVCEECGDTLTKMSKETRRELVVIPATVKLVEHVQNIYTCENCRDNGTASNIQMARAPEPVIPHSFVSPSLLAYIVDRKYSQALPLYRQEQQWKYFGFELSRQNMANWVIKGAELLMILFLLIKDFLLKETYIHADESELQVLSEPGKKATSKSYMWLYCTGERGPPIYLYDYRPSRSGDCPKKFLKGFSGIIQTDGYEAYNKVEGVTLMACLSHIRRYFADALKALPKDADVSRSLAEVGRKYCNKLFKLERSFKDMPAEERYFARLEKSKPLLDEFHDWLTESNQKALPKSALGKAIKYCLNQWDHLIVFLLDGNVEISNNRAERALKSFVIGRKNFLFAKSPAGAGASAVCYSIIETAKANGLSPFHYLTHLFNKLPNLPAADPDAINELLPWSDKLPASCYVKPKP